MIRTTQSQGCNRSGYSLDYCTERESILNAPDTTKVHAPLCVSSRPSF